MPGTDANPVRLDIFQRIIEVGWPTAADFLVFEFALQQVIRNEAGDHAYSRFRDITGISDRLDPWTQFKRSKPGGRQPSIVIGQFSSDMLSNYLLFAYPPVITVLPDDTRTIDVEIIDFAHYAGHILGGAGDAYGGDYATFDEAVADFTNSFIFDVGRPPEPGELQVRLVFIITSHTETQTITDKGTRLNALWFMNLSQFKKAFNRGDNGTVDWKLTTPPLSSQPHAQSFSWTLRVSAFRKRVTFARTADNAITSPSVLRLSTKLFSGTSSSDFTLGWNISGSVKLKTLEQTGTALNNRTQTAD